MKIELPIEAGARFFAFPPGAENELKSDPQIIKNGAYVAHYAVFFGVQKSIKNRDPKKCSKMSLLGTRGPPCTLNRPGCPK